MALGTSWRELVSIVDELHPDVVCLQETKHPNPFPTLPGYECFSSPFQRVHHRIRYVCTNRDERTGDSIET